MNTQPTGQSPLPPAQALRLALGVILIGIVAIMAANVDPWMLVMLAGLAVTMYASYDRTGEGWSQAA